MNASITDLNTSISNNDILYETLSNEVVGLTSTYTTLNTSFASLSNDFNTLNTSFLVNDLASLDTTTKNLSLAYNTNISTVTIDKPLTVEGGWTIKTEDNKNHSGTKLCFEYLDEKVLCLNNSDVPLEIFDTSKSTHSNFSTTEYFIRGPN
jgi:hypothetical protein